MSKCFIEGAGGIAKLFAAIGVTYPEGSILSCSNGVRTLKARDTSGKWIFAIPYAGQWTLTITDGTQSKSQMVEISVQGQTVDEILNYELVLFDGGDNAGVSGGWIASEATGCTLEVADTISVTVAGGSDTVSYRGLIQTSNLIPLANVSRLDIVIDEVKRNNTTLAIGFGVFKTITSKKPDWIASVEFTEAGEYSLDVSEITEDCYVGFNCLFIGKYQRSVTYKASKVIGT